jgi:hypothetical protein
MSAPLGPGPAFPPLGDGARRAGAERVLGRHVDHSACRFQADVEVGRVGGTLDLVERPVIGLEQRPGSAVGRLARGTAGSVDVARLGRGRTRLCGAERGDGERCRQHKGRGQPYPPPGECYREHAQNRLGVLADISPPWGRGRHVQGNVATKHIRTCCTAIGPRRPDVPALKQVFFSKMSKLFGIRSK